MRKTVLPRVCDRRHLCTRFASGASFGVVHRIMKTGPPRKGTETIESVSVQVTCTLVEGQCILKKRFVSRVT